MRRRSFGTLVGGLSVVAINGASPRHLRAQSGTTLQLGLATIGSRDDRLNGYTALFERLAELGYVEGRNLEVDFNGGLMPHQLGDGYMRAVRRGANLLFATGVDNSLLAAQVAAAGRVPIVFVAMDYDPIRLGYVSSIARPGGNFTGVFVRQPELAAKRVELAQEALPHVRRLVLWTFDTLREQVDAAADAARTMGLEVSRVETNGNPGQSYESTFKLTVEQGPSAVILPAYNTVRADRAVICRMALSLGLPLVASERALVESGALMSYGVNVDTVFRTAADYIGRIARGDKPGDLPIQQPTKFELVINLKTAKALGLTIPPSFLARADEVIE